MGRGEGQNTMGMGVLNTMCRGVNIPWIGSSIYHGWGGGQNTMGMGFNIPWVGGSKYHGVQNTICHMVF